MGNASRGSGARLAVNPKAKLLDQVRDVMRFLHYSIRTEKAYIQWIKRFLAFHRDPDRSGPNRGWRHPRDMGPGEVKAFLTHLAVNTNVAASTQNQALNAIVFLYEQVLEQPLGDFSSFASMRANWGRLYSFFICHGTRSARSAAPPCRFAAAIGGGDVRASICPSIK